MFRRGKSKHTFERFINKYDQLYFQEPLPRNLL